VEALGVWSERIEDPDEIIPAIKRAEKVIASGKPALLEIITKPLPMYGGWSRRGLGH
jgi:thiamine pyrophosphate-dependent acetolactate synthase large subunit-like protein